MFVVMCRLFAVSLILLGLPLWVIASSEYVGVENCRGCHDDIVSAWQSSHHYEAMQPANDTSVRGDFDGQQRVFHGIPWRMEKGADGYTATFGTGESSVRLPIRYTFGVSPLQQYLVEQEGGHLQALNVAWDSRPLAEGGQRWFHLREEMTEDSPFSWDRHLQNWNGRCAECHSTNVSKTFDRADSSYTTSFSEVNVGCEACHGPAGDHVSSARNGEPAPLFNAPSTLSWKYGEAPIAVSEGTANDAHIDMCGGCHSRRSVIGEIAPGGDYHDQYDLSLLEGGLYYPDGQIRDEVFVLGSFMQSKMHAAGVTCMNCHDAHTGRLKYDDNRLCAQCHNPASYDVLAHTRHEAATAGVACVDCHMPETTYMMVDDRRDHRFGIPDPALSISHDIPNACNGCHDDKTPEWAVEVLGRKGSGDVYARIHARLQTLDPLAVNPAIDYINSDSNPVIRRATLLAALPMTEDSIRVALEQVKSGETLLRQAAARKLGEAPAVVRQMTLPSLADDPHAVVRREAGRGLVELASVVSIEDLSQLLPLLRVYQESLMPSSDLPSTMTEQARVEQSMGRTDEAESLFRDAIQVEPHYVPALLNLADLYRTDGDAEAAGKLLRQAVEVAPDSGAANHSYGLYLVRQGKTEASLLYLKEATLQADASPRFAYVYAVALDSVSRTAEAVGLLQETSRNWPNQFELLMLEVVYREKTGLLSGINTPLRALSRVAPEDPQVQPRLRHYRIQ